MKGCKCEISEVGCCRQPGSLLLPTYPTNDCRLDGYFEVGLHKREAATVAWMQRRRHMLYQFDAIMANLRRIKDHFMLSESIG